MLSLKIRAISNSDSGYFSLRPHPTKQSFVWTFISDKGKNEIYYKKAKQNEKEKKTIIHMYNKKEKKYDTFEVEHKLYALALMNKLKNLTSIMTLAKKKQVEKKRDNCWCFNFFNFFK